MELIQGNDINALRRLQRALHYMLIETFIVSLFRRSTTLSQHRVLSLLNFHVGTSLPGLYNTEVNELVL